MMLYLFETAQEILAQGKINGLQMERLRRALYANGKIDRPKANFLVALQRRMQHQSPALQRLVRQAIKDHLLAHERLGAEEADWLRQVLLVNGAGNDEERQFLHEIMEEAKNIGPEFEALVEPSTMLAPGHRACGYESAGGMKQ